MVSACGYVDKKAKYCAEMIRKKHTVEENSNDRHRHEKRLFLVAG